ncbi:transcriptional regulator family: Fungal Specific TF [Penicillium roqueforti]|uniref:Zn(2)-C6 fungal-type DNA-binding domain n=1 Tax=Penicillium roqueforti (strain FM164) TaxID=1365484 RepID=W6QEE9_PENRF|nr:transcriptional regulator family: Fungal Specific TF [Penicillium roqueforti]CDM34401.1 Zn(2)-C6 fungal-type DNA-binding domain [Penicillium roqueforti FM164]KAI2672083.1 transcriptional regulator family: Fungal Specific TF [Penicillium roqueforti]KAI2705438.1 transcriptional regulator family: Fungal Specific TF [Penicillium roqueforti]KAI2725993.1 transcriptional regulator family: Fungal Specific TF [Penicillium roqueforti]
MTTLPPGRRSHRKSRSGCLQCKKRKVKCDENQPHCRNCEKHGVVCSFTSASTVLSTPANSAESPVSLSGPESTTSGKSRALAQVSQVLPSLSSLGPFPSTLAVFDLELLHHWTTSTCYTLSRSPTVQTVWCNEAPRIGFATPPVLHTLLAFSALHLARSDESRRAACLAHAQMHHSTAVREMIPLVSPLARENGSALFIFSSLTCMFSCAKPSEEGDFLVLFERGNLSEWARLFRGTTTVIHTGGEDLRTGRLAPIFTNGAYLAAAHRSPQALEQGKPHVWELQQMIWRECAADPSLRSIYQEALDELARTLGLAIRPGIMRRLETADIFRWLLDVSDEYLNLLRQEAPIALIIFAHWCASIRQIEWMWWMEGLSSRLMTQLYSVLDPKYRDWLSWPQEIINRSHEQTG